MLLDLPVIFFGLTFKTALGSFHILSIHRVNFFDRYENAFMKHYSGFFWHTLLKLVHTINSNPLNDLHFSRYCHKLIEKVIVLKSILVKN